MRKLVVAFAILLSVFAASAEPARATHSGQELRTYGRGEIRPNFGTFDVRMVFSFSAWLSEEELTDPVPEPHGHMRFEIYVNGELVDNVSADVTCLTVVGNHAVIGGRATRSLSGISSMVFSVTDNTLSSGVNVVPDTFGARTSFEPPPQVVCPTPPGESPLTRGEIVVEQH